MIEKRKIIVAEDEQPVRLEIYDWLARLGHEVVLADSGTMLMDCLHSAVPDLVLIDLTLPDMAGGELLRRVREAFPALPCLVMSDRPTVEGAVDSMRGGAADYLVKPLCGEAVEGAVERALAAARTLPGQGERFAARPQAAAVDLAGRPLIGRNPRFLRILQKASSVASSKATVLILGESGTGKEVVARYIHRTGGRRNGPFVALNCAALPDGLLESELFGHEKGAFTGAIMAKKGKFELAHGGILLLDEIGEIPLHLQAKLLRVLQEEEVDRLGGKAPQKIDVHVVATTNRDLEEAVRSGVFRQDLYYRLNVIPLLLPALRERTEDILPLAEYFIERYSRQYDKPARPLSREAGNYFQTYAWPGNVRELENIIERGVLLAAGREFRLSDFWDEFEDEAPPPVAASAGGQEGAASSLVLPPDSGEVPTLRDVERQLILQALQKTDDNRTHAARILGISVRTLRNKLHEYRSQGLSVF